MAVDAWGKQIYDPSSGLDPWGNALQGGNGSSTDQWGRPITANAPQMYARNGVNDFSRPEYYTPPLNAHQKNQVLGNEREDSIANFVQRMQRPQDTAMNQQFAGDVGKYGGALDAQIAAPVPVANQNNRFEAGLGDAESRLKSLLDNPDSINQSAAYKFRVNQGQEALQRSLGAKGMLNSGNRLMDLTKYGQDMGAQEYDAQFGRLNGLNNTYAQSWLGDKNANTSRFAAESTANNARTGTLADLYKGAGTAYNQNTQIGNSDRVGWGGVWNAQKPVPEEYKLTNRAGWPV